MSLGKRMKPKLSHLETGKMIIPLKGNEQVNAKGCSNGQSYLERHLIKNVSQNVDGSEAKLTHKQLCFSPRIFILSFSMLGQENNRALSAATEDSTKWD